MKAQLSVITIMVALVIAAAFPHFHDCGNTQKEWSTANGFIEAGTSSPLPDLSESVAPSRPNKSDDQTDNITTVTSGGAVRASFTVVPQPTDNREETVAAERQAMPDNESQAAVPIRSKSGGLTAGWALLAAVLSFEIMAVSMLAFRCLRPKAHPDT